MPDCACDRCQHPRKDREVIMDKETRRIYVRVTCFVCGRWLADEQSTTLIPAAA